MFRVIHHKHRRQPLGTVPSASRFSDPAGNYAVLYVAESVRCGFWEAVARNRFTRRRCLANYRKRTLRLGVVGVDPIS